MLIWTKPAWVITVWFSARGYSDVHIAVDTGDRVGIGAAGLSQLSPILKAPWSLTTKFELCPLSIENRLASRCRSEFADIVTLQGLFVRLSPGNAGREHAGHGCDVSLIERDPPRARRVIYSDEIYDGH